MYFYAAVNIMIIIGLLVFFYFYEVEIHENLHIYFSKGTAERVKKNHCNFLESFKTELSLGNQIIAVTAPSFFNIAFGVLLLNMTKLIYPGLTIKDDFFKTIYFIIHYHFPSMIFIFNLILLIRIILVFLLGFAFIGFGVTNLLPISQDGVVFLSLLIETFCNKKNLPDLFSNKLVSSRYTRTLSQIAIIIWWIILCINYYHFSFRLITFALICSGIISGLVWRDYNKRQTSINGFIF
ncbi:hypothetical protein Desaci_4746 (plasmid) [Desulfosporosinus acidiphilus SJ4]|uniref:Uncharacterized protein n=1 Tax=Desulfosporosinus acidiphilus (strain DSM 22704 / JCM 16185 / SJ4) TaxID=646529 RepID=I4DCP8_DESAJ|nr:hypothetical protein [Desulfosporosinus acidiphilus]AFM43572.1 hypothetical protein Desaci_4746 [Desulfosporosinus acidiphilus SJ4]